jgi:hypothetical protein
MHTKFWSENLKGRDSMGEGIEGKTILIGNLGKSLLVQVETSGGIA